MERETTMRILHSWLSLKAWVKAWLIWLNLVLFAAFFFLRDPLALYALLSLPATFVLLWWIARRNRGLVRLLGIAHLVPWVPLILYTELRLVTGWVEPQITPTDQPWLFAWALTLFATLAVCLMFDAYDVVRWFRGERFVLGSKAAFHAGASKLSPALADDCD